MSPNISMKMLTKPKPLGSLQADLGIKFKSEKLLKNAFVHRSYINEHKDTPLASNERLEFLGDSVLSLTVSRFLYHELSKSAEGQLTQLRAALVRTETLAKIGQKLSLGSYLYLAKGEEESGGRNNNSILANTFEALIGAIYLDQGPAVVEQFITTHILESWQTLAKSSVPDNKSRLQELVQKHFRQSPTYKLVRSWGPDHDRRFEVDVLLADKTLGRGTGKNKQEAAQSAAADALTRLKGQSLR